MSIRLEAIKMAAWFKGILVLAGKCREVLMWTGEEKTVKKKNQIRIQFRE